MKSDTVNNIAKFVCFNCRKSFERYWLPRVNFSVCPECRFETIRYDHKFRPPSRSNLAQWKMVEFLKDNGFYFQSVYDVVGSAIYVDAKYPTNMMDAKEFVEVYKDQAIILD